MRSNKVLRDDVITVRQAAEEFGLGGERAALHYVRELLHRERVRPIDRSTRPYRYPRAAAEVALRADLRLRQTQARQELGAPLLSSKPCARCGVPIPGRWIIDCCHACMRRAA